MPMKDMVRVRLISADIDGILSQMGWVGIEVRRLNWINELEISFLIHYRDVSTARKICDGKGSLSVQNHIGIIQRILGRPVLVLMVTVISALTVFVPSRVLFFEVEGNETLSDISVVEALERCGVGFGALRSRVRSEKVKNALLEQLPQLQWAGINTFGCRAVITVKERNTPQEQSAQQGIGNILAARDGVIGEIIVTKGSPMCKPGQSVKAGQILISGYTDLGLCLRGEWANGEVFAHTTRDLSVISPFPSAWKGEQSDTQKKIFLIFGKKRINFFKCSGISYMGCVKIYTEKYITLPGGYQLPLGIGKEVLLDSEYDKATPEVQDWELFLSGCAEGYLLSQMISGRIQRKHERTLVTDNSAVLTGQYACYEMIGKSHSEERLILP